MTRNPIPKVLSTLQKCSVQHLLSGGQACVLYGGTEFSRDADIVVLASAENLEALRSGPILDLDRAGEFLVMASTLLAVKSAMLLPNEDPVRIKLIKNTKGYSWELSVTARDPAAALSLLQDLEQKVRGQYGSSSEE